MKTIIAILSLLSIMVTFQNEEEYKDVVKQFYELLYRDSVSIQKFSSVYANASLHYDTRLYLRDSLGIKNPNWELEENRNKLIDTKDTPSYVFKKIKQNLNDITFGLTYNQVVEIIDNAKVSTQGLEFSRFMELSFPNDKKIYLELNSDTPTQVLWVWFNNAILLDDFINNEDNPQKLLLVGTINDKDGFVNIRKEPSGNSEIIGKFKEGDIFYYIPDNSCNWWQVSYEENTKSIIGYVHKSRIKNYIDMPEGLKQKVEKERSAD